jgi:hypothetical protein
MTRDESGLEARVRVTARNPEQVTPRHPRD